ncbi:MAG: fused MFS/spermidine synthase [Flavobacteriales bacterium]|nr:fused MFS/spermidine synthase [Flavobacteriales bacterium]
MNLLLRALSWVWPMRIARYNGRSGNLDVCFQYGRKVLNTANANQSFGSLHTVWQRAFSAIGLKKKKPGSLLLLGLGAGSAVRILRKELRCAAPITAVEADPMMERIAREHFGLNDVPGVTVIIADAFNVLTSLPEAFDLVVVDVFNDHLIPEQLSDPKHLGQLLALTNLGGDLLVNTMAVDEASTRLSDAVQFGLLRSGAKVEVLRPMPENRVMWVVGGGETKRPV